MNRPLRAGLLSLLLSLPLAALAQNGARAKEETFDSPVVSGQMSSFIRHKLVRSCVDSPNSNATLCSKQDYSLTFKPNGPGKDRVLRLDLNALAPAGKKLNATEVNEVDVPDGGGDSNLYILVLFNPASGTEVTPRGAPVTYQLLLDSALKTKIPMTSGNQVMRFLDKARKTNPETRVTRVIDAP